jgi:hypothetical protein
MLSPPRLHYRSVTRVWRCQRAANAGRAQFFIRPKKPSEAPLAPICVPVAKLELSENMEFARPPSISPPGAQHASRRGRRRVGDLQIASRTPCGELALRLQLGILHRSVKWPKLNPADRLFGAWLCEVLGRLAIGTGHRQTGYLDCLAPQGLFSVLDMESSSRPARPAGGCERRPRTDPWVEPRESGHPPPCHSPPCHPPPLTLP